MTRIEAIQTIINDTHSEKSSKTSYKRLVRALKVLGLNGDEQIEIERRLEYRRTENDELYPRYA